jgi:hypothetical protein
LSESAKQTSEQKSIFREFFLFFMIENERKATSEYFSPFISRDKDEKHDAKKHNESNRCSILTRKARLFV